MTDFIWYRNAETGGLSYQARSAQPILAQSGWAPLPDEEVASREQAELDAAAAADRAMQEQAAVALRSSEPSADEAAAAERAMQEQGEVALRAAAVEPADGPSPEEPQVTEENK